MLKIAVVDDHRLIRRSVSMLVDSFSNTRVLIQAENGKDFLEQLQRITIDIVILDLQMPVMNGYDTCKILSKKYPDIKILIVSQLDSKECIYKALELGAHGYFTKNSDPAELENAIKSVDTQGYHFGAELGNVLHGIIFWNRQKPVHAIDPTGRLSGREMEILILACKEFSNNEIAEELNINVRTVEGHRKHIIEKTGAKNFIGVAMYAFKNNLLPPGSFG